MKRTKRFKDQLDPYWYNPDIYLLYEVNFRNELIRPGMLIKIKFERSVFRFDRLVVNAKTQNEWLDVYDTTLGGWRSFHPSKISGVHITKQSRAKRNRKKNDKQL